MLGMNAAVVDASGHLEGSLLHQVLDIHIGRKLSSLHNPSFRQYEFMMILLGSFG